MSKPRPKRRERGKTFLLDHIDPDLWARAKQRAETEGHSLRWIVLTLVDHYAQHGLPKSKTR